MLISELRANIRARVLTSIKWVEFKKLNSRGDNLFGILRYYFCYRKYFVSPLRERFVLGSFKRDDFYRNFISHDIMHNWYWSTSYSDKQKILTWRISVTNNGWLFKRRGLHYVQLNLDKYFVKRFTRAPYIFYLIFEIFEMRVLSQNAGLLTKIWSVAYLLAP